MYWRFFPLTLMDFVPDVIVGALPHPAELARLVKTLGLAGHDEAARTLVKSIVIPRFFSYE